MATRAGVAECSTSPRAQRSRERSIRASWTTGYWGATASIRASIATRFSTTAETIRRASSLAAGSASTSARLRSRIAVGVRCPKSASNTADSATRLPARSERTRSDASATDAVDQHRDLADPQAEQPLDGETDGFAHPLNRLDEVGAGAGDDPQLHDHGVLPDADHDRRSRQEGPPRRTASRDLEHVRDLQRGEAHDLDDDAPPDRQLRRCVEGQRLVGLVVHGGRRPAPGPASTPAGAWTSAVAGSDRAGEGAWAIRSASARSASAMSSGTPVRAVLAATSQPNPIIRRRARPWVMMTAPLTPRSGDPPARS